MAPREGTLTVNGLRLHYLDWGGRGPAIVLHHATSLHAWVWEPIARRLAGRWRVVAFDARGHGDSDKPPSGYGWDALAADLAAFIEALGLGPATVVGHSSGGTAALACAARRPELVARVVALEPVLLPPLAEGGEWRQRHQQWLQAARRRRTAWPSLEEAFRHLRHRGAYAHWREELLRLYLEKGTFRRPDGQVELKMSGELEAQVYEGRRALDIWPLLPAVACPVLLLYSQRPNPGLEAGILEAARRLPCARLQRLADGSHFFPLELPEETAALIEAFLEET
jgi:esterase